MLWRKIAFRSHRTVTFCHPLPGHRRCAGLGLCGQGSGPLLRAGRGPWEPSSSRWGEGGLMLKIVSKRHRKITIISSCMAVFRFDSLCARSMDSVFWTWITEPCPEWWWQERALLCWKFWNYWNDSCYDKDNCIWVVLLFICLCSHKYALLWWVICSILMVDAYKNLTCKFISLTLGINVEYYMT